MSEQFILDDLVKHTGQIVTIFTMSGGASGMGFTGILSGVSNNLVKLIIDIALVPVPIYLNQTNNICNQCKNKNYNNFFCAKNNFYKNHYLGSIAEIPISKIISFSHNAL